MLCLSMPTTKTLLANLLEFHDDDDDDDDDVDDNGDVDDNDDNDDDEGKQWHGMDRAISFCTHTMHTDERPYTNLDDDDFIDDDDEVFERNHFMVVDKISFGVAQNLFLEEVKIIF